jgi:hypothetical protein
MDCLTLEDEDTAFLHNIRNHSPNHTASHPRRFESPCPPWKETMTFEVLTIILLKLQVLWDVIPCCWELLASDPAYIAGDLSLQKRLFLCNQPRSARDETHNLKTHDVIWCLARTIVQ